MVCLTTGISIQELLGWSSGVTHRQMLMLIAWEEEQWNIPNRTDHYLMMLACIQARANSKHPQSIQPKDFALKFEGKKKAKISKDEEAKHLEALKAQRRAMLGGAKRITVVDAEGNVIKPAELPPSRNVLGNNPLLITKAQHAERIRTGNAGNEANGGREGTQVTSTGGRTFTPKHRTGRGRIQQPNINESGGNRTDGGGSDCIVTRS